MTIHRTLWNAMWKLLHRLDAAQQRRPLTAFPGAVLKKFNDDSASQLAGLVAYYAFFSLFPLLLVLIAILGLVLSGDATLRHQILSSSLASFPIIGTQIERNIRSLNVGGAPRVIGLILSLYAGTGVTRAAQVALDAIWGVENADRSSWLRSRSRGLALLALFGAITIATTVIDGWVDAGVPGPFAAVGAVIVSLALDLALFTAAFTLLTSYPATIRNVLPGAILATFSWEILQHAGAYLVEHEVKHLSGTYAALALVIGALFWLRLGAQMFLIAAEVNVVRLRRLWPRPLL
jgi:YihY family inner membrane protein